MPVPYGSLTAAIGQWCKGPGYELFSEVKKLAADYLDIDTENEKDIHFKFIRFALGTVANLAVIPIQDYCLFSDISVIKYAKGHVQIT